jgi:predicted acylesterase/phospholipase RssA
MRERLRNLIDFDRLNSGRTRVSIVATDIESGEPVVFDSSKSRIEIDHLMASCGFLPEFAPLELDGRLLGDGGLSLNAPFDQILENTVGCISSTSMLAMATGQSLWKVPSNEKAIVCSVIRHFSGLNTALNYEKREGSSKVAPSHVDAIGLSC